MMTVYDCDLHDLGCSTFQSIQKQIFNAHGLSDEGARPEPPPRPPVRVKQKPGLLSRAWGFTKTYGPVAGLVCLGAGAGFAVGLRIDRKRLQAEWR